MKFYEDINPRAMDDVLGLLNVDKEAARKLYHAIDGAEQRGYLNGTKDTSELVGPEVDKAINRVSLREYSKGYEQGHSEATTIHECYGDGYDDGYVDGVHDARVNPQVADSMLGASAQACGEPDTMSYPEFYEGDSGDENVRNQMPTEGRFDDNGMYR